MKISKIIIKKFRSIEKADIWISSMNAIVGQNNSGKSSLLKAFNCFFNYSEEKEQFDSGSHSFSPASVSKIEIHFIGVRKLDIPGKYKNGDKLCVEASFRVGKDGCKRTVKYKSGRTWTVDENILNHISEHLEFILIPPNRDAIALRRVGESVLKLLVEEKMQEATGIRDNYSPKFKTAINFLENNALRRISEASKSAFPASQTIRMKIGYTQEINYSNFLDDFGIYINEEGLTHPLEDCGSGIQSLAIISLYNQLAESRNKNIIIGLEEPETNLHPQAQKELIDYFKNLVTENNILHFLFTTHSAVMIDQVQHTEIILFSKKQDSNRGFVSDVKRLREDFFDIYGLDEFKYYQFYRYRNSDFFFSSYIIVTESKTEIEMIKKIGFLSQVDYEINGLSYLNLDGVGKSKYTVCLLNELQIPYLLIVDKDFFFPYENDSYESSLDTNGFPIFKNEFKDQTLLSHIISDQHVQSELITHANTNHTKMLDLLENYGIVSMRYNLELDLAAIEAARQSFYKIFNMQNDNPTVANLTEMKAIKKIQHLLRVMGDIEPSNWPRSYLRIRKLMNEAASNLRQS